HVRDRLRRAPGADPDPHAGRLAGPPAAQGLPPRRHPGGVQGRHHPAAGQAQELQLMSTHAQHQEDLYAGAEPTDAGAVFNASGGDWDEITDDIRALGEERIVVNMGPQHPATHAVLRPVLETDGEVVRECRAGIGFLHTGIEKNMEFRNWTQGTTFCTRMDYVAPLFNEAVYCLAVEKLLGITDDVPERADVIRVLMMELNRITSHLVCLGTGGMEMGATTVMTVAFRERERILRFFEAVTGLRMNHAYIRPGGVAQDVPASALDAFE